MRDDGAGDSPAVPLPGNRAPAQARPPPRWASRLGLTDFSWSLPLFGLCLFTFSIVTYRLPFGEVGVGIAMVGLLLHMRQVRVPFPIWLFAALMLWAFVAGLTSPYASIAIASVVERLKLLAIMLIVVNALRTEGQIRFYLLFFLACYLVYPVRGTLLGGETLFGRARWGSNMYSNPNDLAALSLIALGVALSIMFSTPRPLLVRGLAAVGSVLLLVVMLLTQSRGAFLGFVVGMVPALFWSGMKRPVPLFLAGVVLAVVVGIAVPKTVWERFAGIVNLTSASTIEQADPEGSAAERFAIQKTAWKIFVDHPVFGVGLDAYPEANFAYEYYLGRKSTHNTYLNLAAEVGLPGLLIWLVLVGSVLRYAYRARKRAPPGDLATLQAWIERTMLAYLVSALFGTFSKLTFPYLFLAVLWCSATLLRQTPRAAGLPQAKGV